jgi:hypothetical protein
MKHFFMENGRDGVGGWILLEGVCRAGGQVVDWILRRRNGAGFGGDVVLFAGVGWEIEEPQGRGRNPGREVRVIARLMAFEGGEERHASGRARVNPVGTRFESFRPGILAGENVERPARIADREEIRAEWAEDGWVRAGGGGREQRQDIAAVEHAVGTRSDGCGFQGWGTKSHHQGGRVMDVAGGDLARPPRDAWHAKAARGGACFHATQATGAAGEAGAVVAGENATVGASGRLR